MVNTAFQDYLMIDKFDVFKIIISEINNIKSTLKTQNRRVKKLVCSYTAYEVLKKVSELVNKVFKARRIEDKLAISLFTTAIAKLKHLSNELRFFGRLELAATIEAIAERLFDLLPLNTVIQLELFECDRYESGSKTAPRTTEFLEWLRWHSIGGFAKLQAAFKASFIPIRAYNLSIKFDRP